MLLKIFGKRLSEKLDKPSWQLRAFSALAKVSFKLPSRFIRRHKLLRAILDTNLFLTGLFRPSGKSADLDLNGVPAVEIWSGERPDAPVLYFLHGGAFIFGSAKTHTGIALSFAKRIGGRAVVPNYRLAPEFPFPAAFEDAVSGYLGLLKQGVDPNQIVVAGDSAGGCLTLALLAHLEQEDIPRPACAVTFSALTDMRAGNETLQSNAASEAVLYAPRFPEVNDRYLQGASAKDPRCSPILASFKSAPPILMQVAQNEILLDDTRLMAQHLRSQGSNVTETRYPGGFHVFQVLHAFVPEAKQALSEAAQFVRDHVTKQPTDS